MQNQLLETALTWRLVLSIDEVEVFSFEDLSVLIFDVNDHVGIDVLDGGVVDLLLQLKIFLGNALHLAKKGLPSLELATQLSVIAALHSTIIEILLAVSNVSRND